MKAPRIGLYEPWGGNIDEVAFPEQGYNGLTVRLFDPATELWSIYWARNDTGLGLPPRLGGST